ncbi:hypothetical protein [Paenibacillus sp. KR2-11]
MLTRELEDRLQLIADTLQPSIMCASPSSAPASSKRWTGPRPLWKRAAGFRICRMTCALISCKVNHRDLPFAEHQLLYAERTLLRKTKVYLGDGTSFLTGTSLNPIKAQCSGRIVFSHRSFLVNTRCIASIEAVTGHSRTSYAITLIHSADPLTTASASCRCNRSRTVRYEDQRMAFLPDSGPAGSGTIGTGRPLPSFPHSGCGSFQVKESSRRFS